MSFDASAGSLIAVEGPSGSGRTCLLLALTGRMKTTAGHAYVAGHRLPRKRAAVRAVSALGAVPGVTDLEPALSVAEQLREQALLRRRFDGSLRASPGALLHPRRERAAARARLYAALSAAGLDPRTLPNGWRTRVRDLERQESLRLSLARSGVTVLAECSQAPEGSVPVRTRTPNPTASTATTASSASSASSAATTTTKEAAADALAEAGRA